MPPPLPPLIVAAVGQGRDRRELAFDTPAPPAPPIAVNRADGAAPPLIAPLLVSVVIVPEFDTPAPPAPPEEPTAKPPLPPLIVPLLVSSPIVPAFDTPAPPAPPGLAKAKPPPCRR